MNAPQGPKVLDEEEQQNNRKKKEANENIRKLKKDKEAQ